MDQPTRLVARRGGPLSGAVTVPGDKSISHRAIIFAALADGTSRIANLSDAQDVERTIGAVRALGAEAWQEASGEWRVRGGAWRSPAAPIDCGNSGTTARLLMGALAGHAVEATLTGDESLRRRPMQRVADPLRQMGAQIEGGDRLPVRVRGARLRPIRHENVPASAQVKSAILLAAIAAKGMSEVREPVASRDHSERLLPLFGVALDAGPPVRLSGPQRLRAASIAVPGDFSAAAFLLIAATLVPGSEVTLTGIGVNPLRTGLLDTLAEMGAEIAVTNLRIRDGEPVADLIVHAASLRAVAVPAERAPRMIDEYPILAVAAACAAGETVMQGLAELRHKESDRLARLCAGLTACGVRASVEGDTLRVMGGCVPGGVTVASGGDHRIAMAFLILGLVSDAPIGVDGADMIATSFPGFPALMRALGADIGAA